MGHTHTNGTSTSKTSSTTPSASALRSRAWRERKAAEAAAKLAVKPTSEAKPLGAPKAKAGVVVAHVPSAPPQGALENVLRAPGADLEEKAKKAKAEKPAEAKQRDPLAGLREKPSHSYMFINTMDALQVTLKALRAILASGTLTEAETMAATRLVARITRRGVEA